MYSNNILNIQVSKTILNASTKTSWNLLKAPRIYTKKAPRIYTKKTKTGNYIVQIPDWSYKDNTLLFTRRPINSHRMYRPSPYKKNLL